MPVRNEVLLVPTRNSCFHFCKSHKPKIYLTLRGNEGTQHSPALECNWNMHEIGLGIMGKHKEKTHLMSCCWLAKKMSNWKKKYFNSFVFSVCPMRGCSSNNMTLWENISIHGFGCLCLDEKIKQKTQEWSIKVISWRRRFLVVQVHFMVASSNVGIETW